MSVKMDNEELIFKNLWIGIRRRYDLFFIPSLLSSPTFICSIHWPFLSIKENYFKIGLCLVQN